MARGTALGLFGKAFRLEKLLFLSAENESSSTIGTLYGLVLKTYWMTSSLSLVRVLVIQYLRRLMQVASKKLVIT
jgi:hypothetical protein